MFPDMDLCPEGAAKTEEVTFTVDSTKYNQFECACDDSGISVEEAMENILNSSEVEETEYDRIKRASCQKYRGRWINGKTSYLNGDGHDGIITNLTGLCQCGL